MINTEIMRILLLCVANSARSQMAEGLAKSIFGTEVSVQSAGSHPTCVNPLAIQVMAEIGIDISQHQSKSVTSIDPKDVDTVITLCEDEVCPAFLAEAQKIHWPFPDPAVPQDSEEKCLALFRKVRDAIKEKLLNWKW